MKRLALLPACGVVAVLLAGCLELNIFWSPDGHHALIRGEQRLYLCDSEGKLTQATTRPVEEMAWCPDSKHAIIQQEVEVKTWDDVRRFISPKEIKSVASKATEVLSLAKTWPAEADVLRNYNGGGGVDSYTILYLRQNHDAEMEAALGRGWTSRREAGFTSHAFELCSLVDGRLKPEADLALFRRSCARIRVSPNGQVFAFIGQNRNEPAELWVGATTQPGTLQQVCSAGGASFDWTPDGRKLIHLRALADSYDEFSAIGSLCIQEVCDERGALLPPAKPGQRPDRKSAVLATVVFDFRSGIACLPDGRVVFATPEAKFPSTQADQPRSMSLFIADPSGNKPVQRMLRAEIDRELPEGVPYFQLSPGGKFVLIPDRQGSQVVIDLAGDHKPTTLPDGRIETLPVWQSADTVCYVVWRDGEDRPEVALATRRANGQWTTKVISRDWPEELVQHLAR